MPKRKDKTGVILANLGTPEAPTITSVYKYLYEFLSDKRVVDTPSIIWQPLLSCVILPMRSPIVAKLYKSIWTKEGSPLLAISKKQHQKLIQAFDDDVIVELAMTYGNPSMQSVVDNLMAQKVDKILIMPLYPQYSSTTTAAVFDAFTKAIKKHKTLPDVKIVNNYFDNNDYIEALANSIALEKDEHLIFSFHSLPVRYLTEGDPYRKQCEKTVELIVEKLGLSKEQYSLSFQSRFGREPWLEPFTDETLIELAGHNIKKVVLVCPGFSADCLETLEEIAVQNKEIFIKNGGISYRYIPCLNENDEHINCLKNIIKDNLW